MRVGGPRGWGGGAWGYAGGVRPAVDRNLIPYFKGAAAVKGLTLLQVCRLERTDRVHGVRVCARARGGWWGVGGGGGAAVKGAALRI